MTPGWPDPGTSQSHQNQQTSHEIIEGEVVDAPRVLTTCPAPRVLLRCATHPTWTCCGLDKPSCVVYNTPDDDVDDRSWTERATTFRVVDRRRPSYPRL